MKKKGIRLTLFKLLVSLTGWRSRFLWHLIQLFPLVEKTFKLNFHRVDIPFTDRNGNEVTHTHTQHHHHWTGIAPSSAQTLPPKSVCRIYMCKWNLHFFTITIPKFGCRSFSDTYNHEAYNTGPAGERKRQRTLSLWWWMREEKKKRKLCNNLD